MGTFTRFLGPFKFFFLITQNLRALAISKNKHYDYHKIGSIGFSQILFQTILITKTRHISHHLLKIRICEFLLKKKNTLKNLVYNIKFLKIYSTDLKKLFSKIRRLWPKPICKIAKLVNIMVQE